MATFRIPKFQFARFQAHEPSCESVCDEKKKEEKKDKKKRKRCKIVPTTEAQQAACAEICTLATCPACRPGTLYRQQIGAQGTCCACRSKITSKVHNTCGVGFACVGRGPCGLPCTLPQPADPCPCTACSCLPDPLPCGVMCLGDRRQTSLQ